MAEEAYVVRGRCLPYGRGITFWPLVEIVRSAAEIDDDDPPERARAKLRGLVGDEDVAERLASVTGLSDSAFPLAETFWAVQRLVEILSDRGPLVVVIDDIHSAEPTLLDLIEHLSAAELVVPALILCAARHDLLEERDAWGEGPREERIVLAPLGDDQAEAMVNGLLGQSGLTAGDARAGDGRGRGQPAVRRAARLDARRRRAGPARRHDRRGDAHPAHDRGARRSPSRPARPRRTRGDRARVRHRA